jgi:hypothetical protein
MLLFLSLLFLVLTFSEVECNFGVVLLVSEVLNYFNVYT